MAEPIFHFVCQFSKGLPQLRHQKNRIVSKPARTTWVIRDLAFDYPFDHMIIAGRFSQRYGAAKARAALRSGQPLQSFQDKLKTLLVWSILAHEPGRVHARLTTQSIYF